MLYCSDNNKHQHRSSVNSSVNNLLNNNPNNLSGRNQMDGSSDVDKRVRFNLNNNDVIYSSDLIVAIKIYSS